MKIIRISVTIILISLGNLLFAGDGMWLPLLLKALNESEMQSMGMKLSAEDIYSVNQGSLKDAIVHFGGFCTAEVISDQGLLLTNHHCGYGQIQSHSTLENNLLKDGFWAETKEDELENPGLFARFITRMDDISDDVLNGVNKDMDEVTRQSIIDKNIDSIKGSVRLQEFHDIIIRPFYNGNQYFIFYTVTFNDVRLVGTPPESIGKFGADTDNWVWPRHTGDFSLFRIYAGPNNEPADYSENNVPYTPKHFLPISLDGVEEGDFTMVFGFPGRTNQYLPGAAVEQIVETLNPAKIEIRETALAILDEKMRADEEVRIQYASKFARIANYWKKWIGESQGLVKSNALDKKQAFEDEFKLKNIDNPENVALLPQMEKLYKSIEPYAFTRDYYSEVASRNIELLSVSSIIGRLVTRFENNGIEAYNDFLPRIQNYLEGFYKNYRPEIDREVFAALTEMYAENVNTMYVPDQLKNKKGPKGFQMLANDIYDGSSFTDKAKIMAIFEMDPAAAIEKIKMDPAYQLSSSWGAMIDEKVNTPYNEHKIKLDEYQRKYMQAIIETFPKKRFYPDANSTMRISYGQVNGYKPRDAVYYTPVTYLDGVIEKYQPGDYEFDVHPKLLELHASKDYGQYADVENGQVPVCFLGSNHTTGGNSGSPAIDAHGNLIGLNFDRVWEGTMSDINYDKSICRNIMVDARFILFIVDKFAGATHLIDEMTLVHPKTME